MTPKIKEPSYPIDDGEELVRKHDPVEECVVPFPKHQAGRLTVHGPSRRSLDRRADAPDPCLMLGP
ncbi:hypothetical protein EV129_12933 [Rhizobium azibense]|uniref:Uncharacterized protein n=1 Tax=Rhizobium azibense TaxID=1136135 RepID=A0A4R3R7X2_9HYPH|nr:hypothetical protein EV129_12933 [Rhizobium azibense]